MVTAILSDMTSILSLFHCAPQDVTIERVRELVDQAQPESLTLEYKEKYTDNIIKSIAALANSYGGLILVGVTDKPQSDRLVGISEDTALKIASSCHQKLEPPWQPEIIPVPLSEGSDRFVHVVRVDPDLAPRPVLLDGAAPIRLHGRNATADRVRLAQLFAESSAPTTTTPWTVQAPHLDSNPDGGSTTDFVLRSGLMLPMGEAMIWRPMSDSGVDDFASVLNESPLVARLIKWLGDFGIESLNSFHREGLNRARDARLAWQGGTGSATGIPVEAVATLALPGSYGVIRSHVVFTLDVKIRLRTALTAVANVHEQQQWRLSVERLYSLCDSLIATLVDPSVREQLASIAGVDTVLVPQPTNLHFVCGLPVMDLLYPNGLTPIQDAGRSHGAHLLADPANDLSSEAERTLQIDSWLQQIALDAGLQGMERLLIDYHAGR